jgi:hypothetical protein
MLYNLYYISKTGDLRIRPYFGGALLSFMFDYRFNQRNIDNMICMLYHLICIRIKF